jgi:hypothetical protein
VNTVHAIDRAKKYIARKCGQGDECACETGKRVLVAESISIMAGSVAEMVSFKADSSHPNQLPFRGVLLTLDQSSTKPPHGSRGHRIYVPTRVAEKHLDGLVGMAVNYDEDDLDSHETRHKVGIITKAGIKGNQVWVKGIIWKKDFPEAVGKLSGRRDLGMSMELANVYVRDEHEDVWHLEAFEFTGATILKKSAAAYYSTELSATSDSKRTVLAATAAATSGKNSKGEVMSQTKVKARVAAASNSGGNAALLVGALKGAMSEVIGPLVSEMRASREQTGRLQEDLEELKGLHLIQAAAHEDDDEEEEDDTISAAKEEEDDEEEEEEDDMAAGKDKGKKEEDDDDDENDDAEGEDDDLAAELENLSIDDADEEPGEVNEKMGGENRGDKTTVTNPPTQKEHMKGNIAKKRLQSAASKRLFPNLKSNTSIHAAAVMVETMKAQIAGMKRKNRKLIRLVEGVQAAAKKQAKKFRTEIDTLKAQVERHAESVDRRSAANVPIEIRNLLAKANVDPREIQAGSAEKLTVTAVDSVFNLLASEGVQIEPVKRAEYKNRMVELGLMENGEERYAG